MDNHPIPQDITNFQFRIIGEMTIKQFGYVVAGVVLAWVTLASPIIFLLRVPLAAGFVLISVILAFVPVEGRPFDVIVSHFIKALLNPTQYVYQKSAASQQEQAAIQTITPKQTKANTAHDENKKDEKIQVEALPQVATAAVLPKQEEQSQEEAAPKKAVLEFTTPTVRESALQQETVLLQQALLQAKAQEAHQTGVAQAAEAHKKVTDVEQQLQTVLQQKQDLELQLVALQKQLAEKKQHVFTPTVATAPTQTQHVRQVPTQMKTGIGVPLVPDTPNLITGVVKDPRGNILGNILIEIKDKDGNPVRAFKTNQLGQFAAATPLVNGTYTISFEDPAGKHSFDSVEITASGNVLLPLEITSVDAREKLRQELFGTTT